MVFPLIGGIFSQIFGGISRAVNSPEHNFKKDLKSLLEKANEEGPFAGKLPPELLDKIQRFLDTGTDEEIGKKINALMASGIIPPELGDAIRQIAESNGVPRNSLDQERHGEEMDEYEINSILGGTFDAELEAIDREKEAAGEDGEDEDDL